MNKIRVDSELLNSALKSMMRLAQPEIVNLMFKDDHLILKGAGPSSACKLKLQLEDSVDQTTEITVSISLLSSVIEKCKSLELEIAGTVLNVKSKGYTAEVLGTEDQSISIIPKEVLSGDSGFVLGRKFMNELLKVLPKLELKPLLSTYSEVPIGIKATSKGTFVACFDFAQSATVFIKEATGDFEFILPSISQFNVMAKELSNQKYKLVITDTTMYAWNDIFQVSLSLPQQEGEQLALSDIVDLVKHLETEKFKNLVFKTQTIKDFLGRSRSIYDKDSVFTVKAEGDKAKIELKATVGNTSLITKLGKPIDKTEFQCDLNFFQALVMKSTSDNISLKITPQLMKLKDGPVSYLMSLI